MGYPIRFAVEELTVEGGYADDYADITKGFIVSKCYVLESRYRHDTGYEQHVVCFPFDRFDDFVRWYGFNKDRYQYIHYKHYNESRRIPSEERKRGEFPKHVVSELFDNYFDAKDLADTKNSILRGEQLATANRALYDKLQEQFKSDESICGEYEKFVYENTKDLEITGEKIGYQQSEDSELFSKILRELEFDPDSVKEVVEKYKTFIK